MTTKKELIKENEALKAQITALKTELALANYELNATKSDLEAELAKHTSPYVYTDHCAQLWLESEKIVEALKKEVISLKAENRKAMHGLMAVKAHFEAYKEVK